MARKQRMKVYHGLPKSILDEHTIFYKEIPYDKELADMPTGYGARTTGATAIPKVINPHELTVDFWLYAKKLRNGAGGWMDVLAAHDSADTKQFGIVHDQYNLFVQYPNFNWNNAYKVPVNKYTHIRVTCAKNKIAVYVNGKVSFKHTSTGFDPHAIIHKLYMLSGAHDSSSDIYLSDIHVSDIDRGDYFPNLPQDFIDGKAIVKSRLGQRQIKGDPVYSQITTLKIPSEKRIGQFYNPTPESDGLYRSVINPELAVGSNSWSAGSKLKIKGLNGEIIGGTIDADTVLCKVTKSTTINGTSATIEVDNTSKIQTNDTLRLLDIASLNPGNAIYTVVSKTDNSFTANLNMSVNNIPIDASRHCFIETTLTSSSPTVKTQDGVTVAGTWSGLGTKEAVFTLGTNPNIAGKDLYVEYSLTMSYGNSDFSEIPYSADRAWGENNVEMKPADYLVITDDFKGKTKGNDAICSHYCSFLATTDLVKPSQFTADSYIEYPKIYKDDSTIMSLSNSSTSGNKGQLLLGFNLIDIVEKKLGSSIPSADKVQWLKENVLEYSCTCYCNGSSPSGNKINMTHYCHDETRWYTNTQSHTSNALTKLQYIQQTESSNWLKKAISSTGFIHFVLFTEATNATTACTIRISYAKVSVRLKTDPDYTMLYCENTYSREDKCNPVLIQKETKTVKRYLPSAERFVTECTYAKFTNEGVVSDLDVMANKHFNIGVNTSVYNAFIHGSNINLNQMPLEKAEHLYVPIDNCKIMDSIPNHIKTNVTEIPLVHWWSDNGSNIFAIPTTTTNSFKTCVSDSNSVVKGQRGGYKDSNNNVIIYGDVDTSNIISKDGLRLYDVAIVNKNGELMLYVIKASSGHRFYIYNDAAALIKLPNRPLIK